MKHLSADFNDVQPGGIVDAHAGWEDDEKDYSTELPEIGEKVKTSCCCTVIYGTAIEIQENPKNGYRWAVVRLEEIE